MLDLSKYIDVIASITLFFYDSIRLAASHGSISIATKNIMNFDDVLFPWSPSSCSHVSDSQP